MIYKREFHEIDGVKVYIEDIQNYNAESYSLLFYHNKYNEHSLHKYINEEERKDYFAFLIESYLHNYNNIREILLNFKAYIDVDNLLNVNISSNDIINATLKDYLYIQRDWCYYGEGEKQINVTINAIKKLLPSDMENALFLGCGAGRLAVEFSHIFDRVLATDKSYSMIWHINKLMSDKTFEFYTPHEKNVYSLKNVGRKHTAYISREMKKTIENKLDFFVSDVLDLPLNEKSIDAIFSIYFSDVIALKLWFDGINKILNEGGYFIHFGPLDYFFSAESAMLTADEFKLFFERNGYTTIADEVIETSHLNDIDSFAYKVYRNWLFIAKKNTL
ncbi:hypothetical protein CMT52_13245 [Elizabethkingia anophelis]|nr:hypothetical protein [Elizabethkingia anophelis]MDV4025296.1 hypothetical protein [Elizabethkingia anophelis]